MTSDDTNTASATATGAGWLVGLTAISAALGGSSPKLAMRLVRQGLPVRRLRGSAGPYIVHTDSLRQWIESFEPGALV